MRRLFKQLVALVLIPFFQWYLRKERTFRYRKIRIAVMPGVFHPGFFYSSRFLLRYLETKDVKDKQMLELGCGTGLISVWAAMNGSIVTASDLSGRAVENAKRNAADNGVNIRQLQSDLFDRVDGTFDLIVINPPYYAREPRNESDLAWFAGKDHTYFRKLFSQLRGHTHEKSEVIMVLTKGCELEAIMAIARQNAYGLKLIRQQRVLFDEWDYLFSIQRL